MFKDSQVTRLDAWSTVEEADALPAVAFPAFVGTGRLGIGLDAGGLQSLPDRLGAHYNTYFPPFHVTQSDLYVLREGMLSTHLWDNEIASTGKQRPAEFEIPTTRRNFLPLGFLDQEMSWGGNSYAGDDLRKVACLWRRETSLRQATVRTSYSLAHAFAPLPAPQPLQVTVEVFAPFGGETVFVKLARTPAATGDGDFRWTVRLPFRTRHGLPLFQPGAAEAGTHTILARVAADAPCRPIEEYAVVYGIAADGMTVQTDGDGWSATMSGPLRSPQSAWLRLEFRRFAGTECAGAAACRDALEPELARFDAGAYAAARAAHLAEFADFWQRTADIAVDGDDAFETRRRFLLHMTEYLLRCGNDHGLGGTVQFLLMHQNGWNACNFHDHHYIVDGLARANLWDAAAAHGRWMRRVMRPEGRPFPWMLTYDGAPLIPPEQDRAPMSDANRALLAARLYEYAGAGREAYLRDVVYPIVRTVANHGTDEWFREQDGEIVFRAVENDVMHETPHENEAGTVIMYLTVLRKAIAYSARLGVDADRRAQWQKIVDTVQIAQDGGRYLPWRGAPPDAATTCWFDMGYYLAEAQEYLDAATFRRTRDRDMRWSPCNIAWLNFGAAASEIRLGRPDRAEQLCVDSLENRVHGPGYFEEVVPNGISSLPPFETAHGAHLTAACEQIVLPDFWRPRVFIGRGMPSRWRNRCVRFHGLRALGGMLISGTSEPRRLAVEIVPDGDPLTVEFVLRLPAAVGAVIEVRRDGAEVAHEFAGESVSVRVALIPGQAVRLEVSG